MLTHTLFFSYCRHPLTHTPLSLSLTRWRNTHGHRHTHTHLALIVLAHSKPLQCFFNAAAKQWVFVVAHNRQRGHFFRPSWLHKNQRRYSFTTTRKFRNRVEVATRKFDVRKIDTFLLEMELSINCLLLEATTLHFKSNTTYKIFCSS